MLTSVAIRVGGGKAQPSPAHPLGDQVGGLQYSFVACECAMESVAAVVIGVVGLACARTLARRGIETVILEIADYIADVATGRHAD